MRGFGMLGVSQRVVVMTLALLVAVATSGWVGAGPANAAQAVQRPLVRLMPLGDSITYGVGHPDLNSYRVRLQMDMRASGARLDLVGTQQTGWAGYDRNNEGHSGFTTYQILSGLDRWLGARPNVVLLSIGTNDARAQYGIRPQWSANNLAKIIAKIKARLGYVHVFVAKIPTTTRGAAWNRWIAQYNALIPGVVARAGAGVYLADMSSIGTRAGELADGLHPSVLGYRRMAFVWYRALKTRLPHIAAWRNIAWPV